VPKPKDVVIYGGLAVLAYFLYKKFSVGINSAVNTAASGIANAYVGLTSPAAPVPQGSVIMPDGTNFPLASIQPQWQGNALLFSYAGGTYQLQPHNADGNYPAVYYSSG